MNFLETMTIPELGNPTFQADFNSFCTAIKNNIERLVSVQYTKGNDGNSIYANTLLIDSSKGDNDRISNLSISLINKIFGLSLDGSESISDIAAAVEAVAPVFSGGIFQETSPMGDLLNTPTNGIKLELFIDEHTGVAYMANPFIFIDGRIADLNKYILNHSNIDDTYKHFHDYSTAIYGKGTFDRGNENHDPEKPETWDWEMVNSDIVPKIYFDENIHEFCWEVNNQRTGVTAQGIKGDDGVSANIHMAKGSRAGDIITVESIQVIGSNGIPTWQPIQQEATESPTGGALYRHVVKPTDDESTWIYINDEDLMLVFYDTVQDGETGSTLHPWAYLGKPVLTSADIKLYPAADRKDDVIDAIANQAFRTWLNRICISQYMNYSGLRGLFIPASDASGAGTLHMAYIETYPDSFGNFNRLRISPVLAEQSRQSEVAGGNPVVHHIGDLVVDYNTDIRGNHHTQGNSVIEGDLQVGGDTIIRGNTTIQGALSVDSIMASGKPFRTIRETRPAAVCKFVDTTATITRTPNWGSGSESISVVGVLPYRIKYSVTLSTKLNIKIGKLTDVITTPLTGVPISSDVKCQGSINDALHLMHGVMGGPTQGSYKNGSLTNVQGMWYIGDNNTQEYINGITSPITTKNIDNKTNTIKNAPKLYDVIEYEIPIYLDKTLSTDIRVQGVTINGAINGEDTGTQYSTQYTGRTLHYEDSNNTMAIYKNYEYESGIDDRYDFVNAFERGAGSNPKFSDIRATIGSNTILNNASNKRERLVYAISPSDINPNYLGEINGALDHAMNNMITRRLLDSKDDFMVRGSFDYMGTIINYYIDFLIDIREIMDNPPISSQGSIYTLSEPENTNVSLTITPVGYLEYTENEYTENSKTFRTPIYGALSVNDKHPKTKNS